MWKHLSKIIVFIMTLPICDLSAEVNNEYHIKVSGAVKNYSSLTGNIVMTPEAKITIITESNEYTTHTDNSGYFTLQLEETVTGVDHKQMLPAPVILYQNYPNPFNPSTTIAYEITKPTEVTLEIYSIIGQLVRSYHQGYQLSGIHSIAWDGLSSSGFACAAGIYIYRMKAGQYTDTRKMLLLDGGSHAAFTAKPLKQHLALNKRSTSQSLIVTARAEKEGFLPFVYENLEVPLDESEYLLNFGLGFGYVDGLHPLPVYTHYAIDNELIMTFFFKELPYYPGKNYEILIQDEEFCMDKYGVDDISERGIFTAAGDSAKITILESTLHHRENIEFVTHVYRSVDDTFVFSNAQVLTCGYVDNDAVILGPYEIGQ